MKNLAIFLLIVVFYSCNQETPKIYEWRGDNRAGIYNETNLLKEWPETGPSEIWSIDILGAGYGSPIVTEDKIFITGIDTTISDSTAVLFCFNLMGELQWKTEYGDEWIENFPGSRSAPTVVGDLVYVGSGKGDLYCINGETGTIAWSKKFLSDFDGQYPRFGQAEAALNDGDKVFWTPGGKEHNVVALNRFTGQLIWSCRGFGERPAYNSPKLIQLPGRKIIAVFSAYHLMGIDASSGELLWDHLQDNTSVEKRKPGIGDTHSNTILYDNGAIYYAAGDGNCGVKLSLSEDGTKITEVWRNKTFDNYMGGILKSGDYLYGGGTRKKFLFSANAITGEITDSLKIGTGTLVAADKMLYYYNAKGELNLVNYNQGQLTLKSSFNVEKGTKEHFSHPVIKNGTLYLRHGNSLMAYTIQQLKPST